MKTYKKLYSIFILSGILLLGVNSCSDDTKLGLTPQDGNPPSPPTVKSVENTNGAATIYYEPPTDPDLLYVMAAYTINGVEYSSKSSPYKGNVKVEGFGKEGDYEIELVSVDKSQNKSTPVKVTISPLEPPYLTIYKSLKVVPSFGGIRVTWDNPTESNIIVGVVHKDSIGDWVDLDNFYTSAKVGIGTIRGMDTIPVTFGINIRDRWDNYSQRLEQPEKPYYEMQLSKDKFREVSPILPNDAPSMSSYPVRYIWDGNTTHNCYHSEDSAVDRFVTFDMGQTALLSRFKMWQRTESDSFIYSHNNLKRYTVYGCTEITAKMRETGSLDGWTHLYDAVTHKPSGEGPVTAEDKEYILNGDEHEFPLEIPPVRYIRILMLETWSGGTITQIGEMTFWGQPSN